MPSGFFYKNVKKRINTRFYACFFPGLWYSGKKEGICADAEQDLLFRNGF